MLVSGYLLFALNILTNGFSFLGNNIVGFHLGAILALCLEIAAIIRVFLDNLRQTYMCVYQCHFLH